MCVYAEGYCVKCNCSMASKTGEGDNVKPGTIIDPFGESALITPWNRSVARYVQSHSRCELCLLVIFAIVVNYAGILVRSITGFCMNPGVATICSEIRGNPDCQLHISRSSLRNDRFKFKTLGKSPIISEESIDYTSNW